MPTVDSVASLPFEKLHVTLAVALLPGAVSNPIIHIKKQLNALLLRYNDDLKGILLNYSSDFKFEEDRQYARIMGEFPWLHVQIQTTCLIFKPHIGLSINGNITKVDITFSIYYHVYY